MMKSSHVIIEFNSCMWSDVLGTTLYD